MENRYNPFDDKAIHTTQSDNNAVPYSDRQGFNDVIKHYDAVNGFQSPKQINQVPISLRQIIRWAIIINASAFFGFQIYDSFKNFFS